MNTTLKLFVLLLLSLLIVACGGAAEPTQIEVPVGATVVVEEDAEREVVTVVETQVVEVEVEVEKEVEVEYEPEPVEAPEEEAAESEEAADEQTSSDDAAGGDAAAGGEAASEEEDAAEEELAVPAPEPTPVDNTFTDYGVNPFVETAEDQLSTFALDVDTASYTVMRRYIEGGNLPPVAAVRVEEYVNFFDQGYAAPQDSGFSVYVDGAPSPFHPNTHLLRVGIQGYDVSEEDRKPASLTFVIDVSGSMDRDNRLGLVKQSLRLLVERLRPSDSVALVVYGAEARLVLPPTSGEEPSVILDAIDALRPEGSTNAEDGLRLGYEVAHNAFLPGGINRVILASDGVANVGATGPQGILEHIRGRADEGITMTSIGVGMGNFNDTMMEQLANEGDGTYAYVDTLEEAERLFVDELVSTLQVIALDAKVQVDFNPEVVARYRLLGYENREVADADFRNDRVDAGEMGAGHTATAIYAVEFVPDASGRVATVHLRWQDPDSGEVKEMSGEFDNSILTATFDEARPHYQVSVLASQYAEYLRNSPFAEDVSLNLLATYAEAAAGQLDDEDVNEFAALARRASEIEGQ